MSFTDTPPADDDYQGPPPEDPGAGPWLGDEHVHVDPASGVVNDGETSSPWEPGADDDPLTKLLSALGAVQATLETHQEQLDELEDMLQAIPDGPWAWHTLNTPERKALWLKLYTWVAWLEDRYLRHLSPSRIGVFSADWYRHPVAVELLTALMVAHTSAYRRKASAPSFVLVEWNERCLWPTLDRMQKLGLFTADTESANWDGPNVRPTRRDDDRFSAFVDDDLTMAMEKNKPAEPGAH